MLLILFAENALLDFTKMKSTDNAKFYFKCNLGYVVR